jgi:hypothetical protein
MSTTSSGCDQPSAVLRLRQMLKNSTFGLPLLAENCGGKRQRVDTRIPSG